MPKPRMTISDRWKKRPVVIKYFEWRDEIKKVFKPDGTDKCLIVFFIQMPKSWSKKKKKAMNGTPHQQKPDLDNLVKGFLDAAYEEDCKIWHINASKYWTDTEGCIQVF